METMMLNNEKTKPAVTAENFQRAIHDLFEKNGIMNDVRAYLRGHIVNVLKSCQEGTTTVCQRNFQERLDLRHQALNILVAEYLLNLQFTYTLSVFVSEIPLSNMVFDFAKKLQKINDNNINKLKFTEHDVWSVLNYIGLKCDSEHASNVLKSYKNKEHTSLLVCILNNAKLYDKGNHYTTGDTDTSSSNTSTVRGRRRCRHIVSCKSCRKKLTHAKESKNKKHLEKQKEDNEVVIDKLVESLNVIEKDLIDEMFIHMKSVYETELKQIKAEEQKKLHNSLTLHAQQLKQKTAELENAYKARESELESTIRQKKQFLVKLAKTLKEQHAQLTAAMCAVQNETLRLSDKERSLQAQLESAEIVLQERGEAMSKQIAAELKTLETNLESLKNERETIQKERIQLEKTKFTNENDPKPKATNVDNCSDIHAHYETLKKEFQLLKNHLHLSRFSSTSVTEKATLTELRDVSSRIGYVLNNEPGFDEKCGLKFTPAQVVNDLKKDKNVNFSLAPRSDMSPPRGRQVGAGSAQNARQLAKQNAELRETARKQREEIAALRSQQSQLERELSARNHSQFERLDPFYVTMQRASSTSAASPVGAGEEVSVFAATTAHTLVPPTSHRNRLRLSRRPHSPESNRLNSAALPKDLLENIEQVPVSIIAPKPRRPSTSKQPKTLSPPPRKRSPNCALFEAKRRLKRLEIEAEAVEKSYLDFKRKQMEKRERHDGASGMEAGPTATDPDKSQPENEFDKYSRAFGSKFDNRISTEKIVKPIPVAYSEVPRGTRTDYLDTSLNEFRKLYNALDDVKKTEPTENNKNILPKDLEEKTANDEKDCTIVVDENVNENTDLKDENTIVDADAANKEAEKILDNSLQLKSATVENKPDETLNSIIIHIQCAVNESEVPVDKTEVNNEEAVPITIVVSPKFEDKSDNNETTAAKFKDDATVNSDATYSDDFSADVDNFISKGSHSTISMDKPFYDEANVWTDGQ